MTTIAGIASLKAALKTGTAPPRSPEEDKEVLFDGVSRLLSIFANRRELP